MQEAKKELLKPSKLNLFGLDIRFRHTEEIIRKEKESKGFICYNILLMQEED